MARRNEPGQVRKVMREFAEAFYKSRAWQETAEAYRRSRKGLCERCLAEGIITAGEIVHHKRWLTPENINDPEVTLSWGNLELVCRKHHGEAHSKEKARRYRVDKNGRVIF